MGNDCLSSLPPALVLVLFCFVSCLLMYIAAPARRALRDDDMHALLGVRYVVPDPLGGRGFCLWPKRSWVPSFQGEWRKRGRGGGRAGRGIVYYVVATMRSKPCLVFGFWSDHHPIPTNHMYIGVIRCAAAVVHGLDRLYECFILEGPGAKKGMALARSHVAILPVLDEKRTSRRSKPENEPSSVEHSFCCRCCREFQ